MRRSTTSAIISMLLKYSNYGESRKRITAQVIIKKRTSIKFDNIREFQKI